MFPVIKNYTIVREIGSGGTAIVYEAVDNRLSRTVAIKVLHPHLSKDPLITERFMREARAAARIDHPNAVRLYDCGVENDLYYFIMEYVSGTTVEQILRQHGPLSPEKSIAIMYEIAQALAQAHSLGIIHRDVKPANILLHCQGRAMLSDFGLAHHLPEPRLTTDNAVAGTPYFMSPEQISGKELSAATDIYSWGVCLYNLLTGKLPYATDNFPEILTEICQGKVNIDDTVIGCLSSPVAAVLERSLEPDLRKRIADGNMLLYQLSSAVKFKPSWRIEQVTLQVSSIKRPDEHSPSTTAVLPGKVSKIKYKTLIIGALSALIFATGIGLLAVKYRVSGSRSNHVTPIKETPGEEIIGLNDTLNSEGTIRGTFTSATTQEEVKSLETKDLSPLNPAESIQRKQAAITSSLNNVDELSTNALPPAAEKKVSPRGDSSLLLKTPDSGGIFIYCDPWAEVWVNDSVLGTTPFEKPISLPSGKYIVRLKNGFCVPLVDTVEIIAGEVIRKRYTLLMAEQE